MNHLKNSIWNFGINDEYFLLVIKINNKDLVSKIILFVCMKQKLRLTNILIVWNWAWNSKFHNLSPIKIPQLLILNYIIVLVYFGNSK